jgi:16S rRNA (uracil1498-N3)-methyltransferase
MAWFFTQEEISGDKYLIEGKDAQHIAKSLRMKQGEELTLITPQKIQHTCIIESTQPSSVQVNIIDSKPCENEPDVEITLYQALPKGDKMEYIIQKSVELGVTKIVPVISARCISRPDEKSIAKKQVRWQKIAQEASQQSRRGIVPTVEKAVTFKEACTLSKANDCNIIFYECGGESVKNLIKGKYKSMGMFIGSEGGFEKAEVDLVIENGGSSATLGKRILRAETAPLAAISIIMYETGNFE